MRKTAVISVLSCFSAVMILSCSGAYSRTDKSVSAIRNFINSPLEFVDDSSQKLWEGEINGKWVTYFRNDDIANSKDIVLVTQDRLPYSFRSMEYCDDDRDSSLDKVNIKMFKQGEGWRDVIISSTNSSTFNHANVLYKELLGEINYKRRAYLGRK